MYSSKHTQSIKFALYASKHTQQKKLCACFLCLQAYTTNFIDCVCLLAYTTSMHIQSIFVILKNVWSFSFVDIVIHDECYEFMTEI